MTAGPYESDGPLVLATSDGGATWQRQNLGSVSNQLESVDFIDVTHGWAVGGDGAEPCIFVTGDGGANWEAQDASGVASDVVLHSVSFADATHGWAVGTAGKDNPAPVILATSDGGATWTAQDASTAAGSLAEIDSVSSSIPRTAGRWGETTADPSSSPPASRLRARTAP